MKYIIVFLLLIFSLKLFAGTIDPNNDDSKYLEYAKDFHYIGQIGGLDDKNMEYLASCVVIKPHYILTAAHVVHDAKTCNVMFGSKNYKISKIICNENYKSNKVGFYDIAIGYSEEKIELNFYPQLYSTEDEVGKVCCISGYGFTGNFNTGAIKSDNKRRAGSNIIEAIDRHLLICDASMALGKTSLEFLIASGDSGGGLFIDGKLAGINSCIMAVNGSPKSDYRTESGHTRISINIDWILENTKD